MRVIFKKKGKKRIMIKILPVFNYPLLNTQNQFYKLNDLKEPILPDFYLFDLSLFPSVIYNELKLLWNNQLSYFSDVNTKKLQTCNNLGELSLLINLSRQSFNDTYVNVFDSNDYDFNLKEISLFIIQETLQNRTKYYYYFVEDITQLNKELYQFSLSLDVIKTYFNEIMKLQNIKPLRYFPKVEDYFDFSINDVKNRFYIDPLLPISTNSNVKIPLKHMIKNYNSGDTSYSFSGLWQYFYLGYSSEDVNPSIIKETQFNEQRYYIIAFPKYYSFDETITTQQHLFFNPKIKKLIEKSPYLLKIVESDIPPFNHKKTLNTVFDVFQMFCMENNKTNYSIIKNSNVDEFNHYEDTTYLKWRTTHTYDSNIQKYIYNPFIPLSLLKLFEENISQDEEYLYNKIGVLLFVRENNPNNIERNNLLYNYRNIDIPLTLNNDMTININDLKNSVKNTGEIYARGDLDKFFENIEIGYNLNNKMNVNINKLPFDNNTEKIKLYFTSYISHDLTKTQEKIVIANTETNTSSKLYESFATREEIQTTKITDEYFNYVYLNKNAIEQKQKEMKINNYLNIAKGGIALATSMSTGGLTGVVGLGLGFNALTSLVNNELSKQSIKASLEDKRMTPLQYDNTNINSNEPIDFYFANILISRNIKDITKTYEVENNKEYNLDVINVLCNYGYYTPLDTLLEFRDLFNREKYNFIQLREIECIKMSYGTKIRNNHFKLILDILFNGIRFINTSAFLNNENDNPQIERN